MITDLSSERRMILNRKSYCYLLFLLLFASVGCEKEQANNVEETGEKGNKDITANAENSSVVAPGAKIEKRAGGFGFTEGPAADDYGSIFFTDENNDSIHTLSPDGSLTTFRENTGQGTGLAFYSNGSLIVCEQDKEYHRLLSIHPDGRETVLIDSYQGKPLNAPNDLWIAPGGGIYFTDPYWGKEQGLSRVYYLSPDRSKLIPVIDDMVRPNGVVGTPDGKKLYVIDAGRKETYAYSIQADGTLHDKKFFAPEGVDGMTIDSNGNIYITTGALSVFNPAGNKIDTIEVPERPSNLCFGGKDKQTLFITAQTSLYSIRMRVKGL